MEIKNTYKSFNKDKTIEELHYNMLQYKIRLESIKTEQEFFKLIINQFDYKPHLNVFERLETFKKQIKQAKKMATDLLNEVSLNINRINNKIECEDLQCDNYFIKTYEELELKIFNFFLKTTELKTLLFQYIESTITV